MPVSAVRDRRSGKRSAFLNRSPLQFAWGLRENADGSRTVLTSAASFVQRSLT